MISLVGQILNNYPMLQMNIPEVVAQEMYKKSISLVWVENVWTVSVKQASGWLLRLQHLYEKTVPILMDPSSKSSNRKLKQTSQCLGY